MVFSLTPNADGSWQEKVLHSFRGREGAYPNAGLMFDQAGDIYSTTVGVGSACNGGCGVVFQLTPNSDGSWKDNTVHHFTGKDGWLPYAGLIFDVAGNIYGTTYLGGDFSNCRYGCGVVFRLKANSKGRWKEKVLHYFIEPPGAGPYGGLIFDAAGVLYGTTAGESGTLGSVFQISP